MPTPELLKLLAGLIGVSIDDDELDLAEALHVTSEVPSEPPMAQELTPPTS